MNNTQRYRALAPIRFDYRIVPDAPTVEFKLRTRRNKEKEGAAHGATQSEAWDEFVQQITRVMRVMLLDGKAELFTADGKTLDALPIPRHEPGKWATITLDWMPQSRTLH